MFFLSFLSSLFHESSIDFASLTTTIHHAYITTSFECSLNVFDKVET